MIVLGTASSLRVSDGPILTVSMDRPLFHGHCRGHSDSRRGGRRRRSGDACGRLRSVASHGHDPAAAGSTMPCQASPVTLFDRARARRAQDPSQPGTDGDGAKTITVDVASEWSTADGYPPTRSLPDGQCPELLRPVRSVDVGTSPPRSARSGMGGVAKAKALSSPDELRGSVDRCGPAVRLRSLLTPQEDGDVDDGGRQQQAQGHDQRPRRDIGA